MQRTQETIKIVASLGTHKGPGVIYTNTEERMSSKRLKAPVDLGVHSRASRLGTQEVGKNEKQRSPFLTWSLSHPGRYGLWVKRDEAEP